MLGVIPIRLPLPFELRWVNVFLVPLDKAAHPEYLLIDCGMDTAESFGALETSLFQAGVEWRRIRRIVLTHIHPDHMGLSAKILALTGASIALHRTEAAHLHLVRSAELRDRWIGRAYRESGVPSDLQLLMGLHYKQIRHNFHALAPDRLFDGGEEIPTAIGPLRVIPSPGHSPGHICLYSEANRLLFAGDQILPHITPNISWMPERDTLSDYLDSLQSLKQLDAGHIFPCHGDPFTGHREWIDRTTAHHRERCAQMRSLLAEPRTAHTLVPDLWKKTLSPVNRQFALLEVLSHLEFLRRRGEVRSAARDGVTYWQA